MLLVHPLVAGVEAPRVAAHGDQARLLLGDGHDGLCILRSSQVTQRDLDLHMLAGLQACQGLGGVHLRGRAQDDGVHVLQRARTVGQVGGDMADAVLGRDLAGSCPGLG